MPVNMIAKKMGYRELIYYDTAGVVYSYNTVTTLKHTPGKSRGGDGETFKNHDWGD